MVEVIIVFTVIVVVAAMAIRLTEPDAASDLQTAAQVVLVDIDFTRSLAASNSSTYRIAFNTSTQSYSIRHQGTNTNFNVLPTTSFHRVSDSGQQLDAALSDLPALGSAVQIYRVNTGSFTSGSLSYIDFTPLGSTSNTDPSVVWLTSGTGRQQRYLPISVNPVTGLATVGNLVSTAP